MLVPRQFSIVREMHGFAERLRHAELALARSAPREGEMTWHQVGEPGEPAFGAAGGWGNSSAVEGYPAAFAHHPYANRVHLRGVVAGTSGFEPDFTPRLIFTLPVGFRPLFNLKVPVVALRQGGTAYEIISLAVGVGGGVQPDQGAETWTLVSLDGVSFITAA